jgi:hypothetical protein
VNNDLIAAGQLRSADQLLDVQEVAQDGSVTVCMKSLYPEQLDEIPPGSNCLANAYTSNHERLATEELDAVTRIFLHLIDTAAMAHAMILHIHAVAPPVKILVLKGY